MKDLNLCGRFRDRRRAPTECRQHREMHNTPYMIDRINVNMSVESRSQLDFDGWPNQVLGLVGAIEQSDGK